MLPTGVDFAPFGAVAARPAKCVLNARNNFARVSSLSAALTNPRPPRALDEAPSARMEASPMQCGHDPSTILTDVPVPISKCSTPTAS